MAPHNDNVLIGRRSRKNRFTLSLSRGRGRERGAAPGDNAGLGLIALVCIDLLAGFGLLALILFLRQRPPPDDDTDIFYLRQKPLVDSGTPCKWSNESVCKLTTPSSDHNSCIPDIRKRFLGSSFVLRSHDKYTDTWAMDEKDSSMQPEGMESEIEGRTLLIVSHGDPLQILQTKELAAAGTPENDLNIKNTTSSNHLLSHNTATLH